MRRSVVAAFLVAALLDASAEPAGITPESAHDFLEMGDVSYSINVSPEAIEWDLALDARGRPIAPQIEALERRVPPRGAAGPLVPNLVRDLLTLLELYRQSGDARAKDLAAAYLPALRTARAADTGEALARAYALALLLAGAESDYPEAYEALRPHLESGRADLETCLLAVDLCGAVRNYGLARRVADFYLPRYPSSAELHYSAFTTSVSDTLYGAVSRLFADRASAFLASKGKEAFTPESLSEFVGASLAGMYAEIDFGLLERAAALEPAGYKYALAAATFQTVARFLAVLHAAGLTRELDADVDVIALMAAADEKGLSDIGARLERALSLRPSRDIQAYLAAALFDAVRGRADDLRASAQRAVDLRPDLAAGYDALIFAAFYPLLRGRDIEPEMTRAALEILELKVKNAGDSGLDYYAMAGFRFTRYGMSTTDAERGSELAQMKAALEQALALDEGGPRVRVGMGVQRVLAGAYREAISILDGVLRDAEGDTRLYALQNRGVARGLAGDRAAGIEDLRAALRLRADNPKTVRALAALGD